MHIRSEGERGNDQRFVAVGFGVMAACFLLILFCPERTLPCLAAQILGASYYLSFPLCAATQPVISRKVQPLPWALIMFICQAAPENSEGKKLYDLFINAALGLKLH